MTGQFGLILDGLFIVLLAASIFYSVMLNRRMSRLRDLRTEMLAATREFADAAGRADAGIRGWKKMVEDTGLALTPSIEAARKMKEELTFLVEAGEALANRLAEGPRARAASEPVAAPTAEQPAAPAAAPGSVTPLKAVPKRRTDAARRGPDADVLRALENLR